MSFQVGQKVVCVGMKPKVCAGCAVGIKQKPHGRRLYCDGCRVVRKTEKKAQWYERVRMNSPAWAAKNKRRARAWREKNAKHVRQYKAAYKLRYEVSAAA